jgi:transposase
VQQRIVRYVGVAMDDAEEVELKRLAEVIRAKLEADRSHNLPLFAPEEIAASYKRRGPKPGAKARPISEVQLADVREEQRVIEGIGEVFGALFATLGFNQIAPRHTSVLLATVLARIANPVSKRRTAALLEQDYGLKVPLERIYRMMDELYERRGAAQDIVRGATLALFPEQVDVIFFDVTTLYFESTEEDELRGFGYSKDQKYHLTQVVLALATTRDGLPVGYKLFHGATAEVKTLLDCVGQWRLKAPIGKVMLVADRAMMSEANLQALEAAGIEYVVGASLRKQNAKVRTQVLEEHGYALGHLEGDFVWIKEFAQGEQRRLITAYSARRARKDASDRKRILEKLAKRLGKQAKGGLKKLVSNQGYLKYTRADGGAVAAIDEDKVAADAAWDGMYGVITNAKDEKLSLLSRYRQLWTIEESFRISKHDLMMRPIFHWKKERIEAHVAICYLAYALLRHAQHRVRLRQHQMSADHLREELFRVQASIVRDKRQGGLYRIPSRMTEDAKAIYKAFDLKRDTAPTSLAPREM